jgi:FkbM family methyltransferase
MQRVKFPDNLETFCLNLDEARFVHKEIFEDQVYIRHGISLSRDSCVFDVGANIGLFDVYLARNYPGIRIFSFEPFPQTFEVLRANAELHGVNSRLFECALGEERGVLNFTFYPNNSVMSGRYADHQEDSAVTKTFIGNKNPAFLRQADSNEAIKAKVDAMIDGLFEKQTIACAVRTISEIIETEHVDRIDLLKIDVEKSEHVVLAGILEADWPRIGQAVVEAHDVNGRLEWIAGLFRRTGFKVQVEQDPLLRNTNVFTLYAIR